MPTSRDISITYDQPELDLRRRGRKLAKLPAPKEHIIQIAVAEHLRIRGNGLWAWTHFPAGELRNDRTGAKLKAMGLQAGWPDLIFISPDGRFHGLELKRPGKGLSADQAQFRAKCVSMSWVYEWTSDLDEALRILEGWGALLPSIYKRGPA
jgi:hypothetical protein